MFEAKKLFSTALATAALCMMTSLVGGAVLMRAEPVAFEARTIVLSVSTIGKPGSGAYGAEFSAAAIRTSFGIDAGRAE